MSVLREQPSPLSDIHLFNQLSSEAFRKENKKQVEGGNTTVPDVRRRRLVVVKKPPLSDGPDSSPNPTRPISPLIEQPAPTKKVVVARKVNFMCYGVRGRYGYYYIFLTCTFTVQVKPGDTLPPLVKNSSSISVAQNSTTLLILAFLYVYF